MMWKRRSNCFVRSDGYEIAPCNQIEFCAYNPKRIILTYNMGVKRAGTRVRTWKTAESAMKRIDELFPIDGVKPPKIPKMPKTPINLEKIASNLNFKTKSKPATIELPNGVVISKEGNFTIINIESSNITIRIKT